ncbi:hypothetical protein N9D37_00985 [Erythrobacter sp.]|nr:hypothetical protein [Erythrobacter sp.]
MDDISVLLNFAAAAASTAASACKDWEDGGDPGPVADTAWEADEAISVAVGAATAIDPALPPLNDPETRLGRLVVAAQLLILAGTDEGGQSDELEVATMVLKLAAAEA